LKLDDVFTIKQLRNPRCSIKVKLQFIFFAQDDITPLKAATAVGNVDSVSLLLQLSSTQEKSPSEGVNVQPGQANRIAAAV
jgi:hypothetical protein